VTVHVGRAPGPWGEPVTDPAVLLRLAQASRASERMRFAYRTGDDRASRRHAEPHRLVLLNSRWYLVAFDLDRDDWRTFRVDRIGAPQATGARAVPRAAPDAAALVAEGVAVGGYESAARVQLAVAPPVAARLVSRTIGVLEAADPGATHAVVRIGGDADWIARYLVSLPCSFEILEPDAVRVEVRRLANRLLREHPAQR